MYVIIFSYHFYFLYFKLYIYINKKNKIFIWGTHKCITLYYRHTTFRYIVPNEPPRIAFSHRMDFINTHTAFFFYWFPKEFFLYTFVLSKKFERTPNISSFWNIQSARESFFFKYGEVLQQTQLVDSGQSLDESFDEFHWTFFPI